MTAPNNRIDSKSLSSVWDKLLDERIRLNPCKSLYRVSFSLSMNVVSNRAVKEVHRYHQLFDKHMEMNWSDERNKGVTI